MGSGEDGAIPKSVEVNSLNLKNLYPIINRFLVTEPNGRKFNE